MSNSLNAALFRFKPLAVISVIVIAVTSYAVVSTVRSTYEHPTYTIHKVFQTRAEYDAFQAELRGMEGVAVVSSGFSTQPPIEADFKVTAPPGFPYGTANYGRNSAVIFPIVMCVLVLGTLWGFALQRKAREDGQSTQSTTA